LILADDENQDSQPDSNIKKINNELEPKIINPLSPLKPQIKQKTPIKTLKETPKSSIKTPKSLNTEEIKEELKEEKSFIAEKHQTEILTQLKDSTKLKPLSHKNYNPSTDAIFNKGEPVPFCFLVTGFEEASKCKGENSKEAQKTIMSNIFRSVINLRPDHLIMTYYLCILKTTPDYVPSELGVGNEILMKSISKITGRSEKQIRDNFNKVNKSHKNV